jgi:peptide/nickel transport system permease protein
MVYITKRAIESLVVLILVSIIVFCLMRLLPGDPILMLVTRNQQESFSEERIEEIKHQYGLDKPLLIQYFSWVKGISRGDFGKSLIDNTPVLNEVTKRIPITLNLSAAAFITGIIIGIPAGVLCAIRRGKLADTIVTFLANLGITVPSFWLGFVLIYLFSLKLNWLPVMGYTSPFRDFSLNIQQIIMPVICLAVFPIASTARQTRSSMLEVMKEDYIRTAWSKGLRERLVILRHGLKNGLIPVVTLLGMSLSMIIGGSVIIETVFNIPGMGRLAASAVSNQDYPYIQCVVFFIAIVVLLVNFLVDMTYAWLDPRIKYE